MDSCSCPRGRIRNVQSRAGRVLWPALECGLRQRFEISRDFRPPRLACIALAIEFLRFRAGRAVERPSTSISKMVLPEAYNPDDRPHDRLGRFEAHFIHRHFAALHRFDRQAACLEKTCGPQPFVDAQFFRVRHSYSCSIFC